MRSKFRLALAFTTGLGTVLSGFPAARAQVPAPPPPPAAQDAAGAPPSRVGEISLVRGSVSFDSDGTSQWTTAALNYPVTGGDALYTQPGAEAAIAIDGSRITMNEATELQVTSLGAQAVDAALSQGEVLVDVRDLAPGSSYAITTPRGTVNIAQNGQYDVVAGDQNTPTTVTVIAGAAQLQGQNVSLDIAPGETATLQGADPVNASLGAGQHDAFVTQLLEVQYSPPPRYVPPVVGQMTGGYELSQYGSWSQSPQYGAVWYPRVASGWVPYRDGHWAYVAPWGWTWVDNDPWGFAPFHYGRWVQYGGRWGWAPAPVEYSAPAYYQPVYAPATVSFFGIGAGVAIGVGITAAALAAGSIGWVPLAPNEPYLPWYRTSPQYVQRINDYNIRNSNRFTYVNNTTIINHYGPDRLINRGAATVIPAGAMRRGDPVGRFGRPAPQTILASARPVPPAGFHPTPGRPVGGVQTGQPAHGFGQLPGAPGNLVRRVVAPAPRSAPFAAARGLPVARSGPIRPAVVRPQIHVLPRTGVARPPVGPQRQGTPSGGQKMMPPAMRPLQPGAIARPGVPVPPPHEPARPTAPVRPATPVRPAFHPPVQPARPVPPRPQFHPPVQAQRTVVQRPPQQVHPAPQPQQFRPQPPAQPQFHPAPQARPVPEQRAVPQRPAPQRPAPQRPAPHPAPNKPDQQHP